MSLSKYIQTPELLESISGKITDELKSIIIEKGRQWYSLYPEETALIKENLCRLGVSYTPELIEKIQLNIILHYYEKLLPLCGGAQFYYSFLKDNVDSEDALIQLRQSYNQEKGILLCIAHFGAVEFLVPSLSTYKLPLNVVLRFTTEQFSKMANQQTQNLEKSGCFGPIKFIEIGKPGSMTALEMAAVLRRGEILVSVFDEKTDYSKPVDLLGKKVYGGSGLDRLLAFANTPVDVYTAFMLRTDNRYKLHLHKLDQERPDILQQMYSHLETMLGHSCEQWYFLHEEIPFVD